MSGELRFIDSADYALIVMVDKRGVADMHADGVSHAQAAEWMRMLLDMFEQKHGLKPDGSFAAKEIQELRSVIRRLANNEPMTEAERRTYEAAVAA